MNYLKQLMAFVLGLKDTQTGKLAIVAIGGAVEERLRGQISTHQAVAVVLAALIGACLHEAIVKIEAKLGVKDPKGPSVADLLPLLDVSFVQAKLKELGVDAEALKKAVKSLAGDDQQPPTPPTAVVTA